MRGQWIGYNDFNLVELIEEVKTRFEGFGCGANFRIDSTLHGAMIVGKDYYGTCEELRRFLESDDSRNVEISTL